MILMSISCLGDALKLPSFIPLTSLPEGIRMSGHPVEQKVSSVAVEAISDPFGMGRWVCTSVVIVRCYVTKENNLAHAEDAVLLQKF